MYRGRATRTPYAAAIPPREFPAMTRPLPHCLPAREPCYERAPRSDTQRRGEVSAMVDKLDWIWMDGEMVRWEDARVHILTHTIHYGTGAFEGIRAYRRDSGETQVFRLREHIDRLFDSAKMLQLKMPFTREQVVTACLELVRANKTESCYLRPLVFLGDEAMGLYAPNNTVHVSVVSWRWGAYLGEEALKRGIRAKVSSYARGHINATMAKGKISGHYVNSILAKREAKSGGYDEAIMLAPNGLIAECTGENIFAVRNDIILTPPLSAGALEGITQNSVSVIARDLGFSSPAYFTRSFQARAGMTPSDFRRSTPAQPL